MLNYQLSYFEKLVRHDLFIFRTEPNTLNNDSSASTIAAARTEKDRILLSFTEHLFNLNSEQTVEWYIQTHQNELVHLMNVLDEYMSEDYNSNGETVDTIYVDLHKNIYHILIEVLSYLEDKFSKYLDINCSIPPFYLAPSRHKFEEDLSFIEQQAAQAGINEKFLQILLKAINFFNWDQNLSRVTYHDLFYIKELLKRIKAIFTDGIISEASIEERIQALLFYIDFNPSAYFNYYVDAIKEEVAQLPTLRAKLDRLTWHQKCVSQLPVKPGFSFSPWHPALRDVVKKWLHEEIIYLKGKQLSEGNKYLLVEELTRWQDFKVATTFSVPQLGNLLKLMVDSGKIVNDNITMLTDFFSFFFTSAKKENISPGSLRTNFYKEDASVSKSVRDILLTLVNTSQKGQTK